MVCPIAALSCVGTPWAKPEVAWMQAQSAADMIAARLILAAAGLRMCSLCELWLRQVLLRQRILLRVLPQARHSGRSRAMFSRCIVRRPTATALPKA